MDIREHSIFISWEVGEGGREGGLRDLGGTTSFFRGVVVRISCVQQSAKWELQKIDCQLTTNAYGGRGGSHGNYRTLWVDQVNFIVTQYKIL